MITGSWAYARKAASSLKRQATKHGVDLSGVNIHNFNTFLDDAFGDGGEIRCVMFTDLIDPYALRYGPYESVAFDDAKWATLELAFDLLNR